MGGGSLGAALFGPGRDEGLWYVSLLLIPSAFLLLLGTGTMREPLFLCVFLPAPILMSAGYHLRTYHTEALRALTFVGMAMPFITYPFVILYYRRRRTKAEA